MRFRLLAAVLAAAFLASPVLSNTARASDDGALHLRKADLSLRTAGRHAVKLKGTLDFPAQAPAIEPFRDLIRVTVGDTVVLELPAGGARPGLRSRSHGRYRFRDVDAPRRRATRFDFDLSTGAIKLSARALDLAAVRGVGPDDVLVRVEFGDAQFELEVDFQARRNRWRFRSRRGVAGPPGGGGGAGGGQPGGAGGGGGGIPPVPDGAVALTSIATGQFSGITAEENVVVRTQAAFDQLWARHGSGVQPAVDFSRDMVVGIFLGNRPSAGYGATVWQVTATSGSYTVSVSENQTQGSCAVAAVVTQPFALAKVARNPGSVSFSKSTAIAICHGGP